MKHPLLLLLGSTLTLVSLPGIVHAESKPEPYHYGMPLDIHRVLAMDEPTPNECTVVEATMKYVDKAGEVKHISYSKHSEACLFQN